jgi:hypothetical protein
MSSTVAPPAQHWVSSHPGAARRLSGGAALMVAALVVRGTGGVLLGIVATLLLLDAVMPMPAGTRSQADDRFRAAVRRRRRARRVARLGGRPSASTCSTTAPAGRRPRSGTRSACSRSRPSR